MLSATSMFCAFLLVSGIPCEPAHSLDQMTELVHNEMAGEHWYQVRFLDKTIGSLHEIRTQLPTGEYALDRLLRFSLMRHRVTEVNERIVFSNEFPYDLKMAIEETTVTHHGKRTQFQRILPIETGIHTQQSALSYFDTIAFHPRVIANRNRIKTRSIDFREGELNSMTWLVSELVYGDDEFQLTSVDGSTTHLISLNGIPVRSVIPGGISLSVVEGQLDRPWEDDEYVLDTEVISVPVDSDIPDHQRLVALTLQLQTNDATMHLWEPIVDNEGYIRMDVRTPQLIDAVENGTAHSRTELPSEPTVSRLINEIGLDQSVTFGKVKRLIDTLYEQITYEDISHPSTIRDTLDRKTGDCTEFADVVDAVATRLGWNSRIRTGLAYHPPSQSFRTHSWNEIAIDGHWISADASWGQFPADASHVPFPRANILALLANSSNMRFDVVDRQYTSN